MSGIMAITMAGMGSRFTKAGYTRPKYEIDVLGRPLFDWSMLSLTAFRDAGWRFRFATRKETDAIPFITERCRQLGITIETIIELDHLTDGQATTAHLLAQGASNDLPFSVYNIDTYVTPNLMKPPSPIKSAGWLPCFQAPGESWSFVRLNEQGKAAEIREKTRISKYATLGLYYFNRVSLYNELYHHNFIANDASEHGERYIAPMYNSLIKTGKPVLISDIPLADTGMLGTPEQVRAFSQNPPLSIRHNGT